MANRRRRIRIAFNDISRDITEEHRRKFLNIRAGSSIFFSTFHRHRQLLRFDVTFVIQFSQLLSRAKYSHPVNQTLIAAPHLVHVMDNYGVIASKQSSKVKCCIETSKTDIIAGATFQNTCSNYAA